MSIYKSSSLAMIPSAYKDGKLYSVRPTDGSGDFTFSRGSNLAATRVASSGYIEKGRENLLLHSNTFSNASWLKANVTTTSGQSGYDGTSNAWRLDKAAASGNLQQNITQSGVSTLSVYAKAGTLNWVRFRVNTTGTTASAYYDLVNGVLGGVSGDITAKIESVTSGWYRLSLTINATTAQVRIYPADGDFDLSGTSGNIIIQDAQLEQSMVATDYIETGASTAQAGILEDMPRLDYSGGATCPSLLLEPQRSNLVTFSEYYDASDWAKSGSPSVTTNSVVSPSGLHNASTLTSTASSDRIQLTRSAITGSATYSAYVKSNGAYTKLRLRDSGSGNDARFNVNADGTITYDTGTNTSYKIEENGNGWYRLSFTFTAAVGTSLLQLFPDFTSGGGSAYVWGVQMEEGGYPTSYIPTYGSSVTRSVDQLETSPYDYQSQGVLGANVGTIILDCETIGTSTGSNDFHMFGATQSIADGYLFRANSGSTIDILERDSNTTSAQWSSIATKQTRNKIAVSYSGADVDIYVNGVAKSVSSGSPVGGGNINGFSNSGSNAAGLIIHQILLFPNKLTDSEMASITTL